MPQLYKILRGFASKKRETVLFCGFKSVKDEKFIFKHHPAILKNLGERVTLTECSGWFGY